jgi:hypothetical protein
MKKKKGMGKVGESRKAKENPGVEKKIGVS